MTPKKAAASPPIPLTTIPAAAALEADVVAALAVPEALPATELLPLAPAAEEAPLLELPEEDVTTTTVVDSPEAVDVAFV